MKEILPPINKPSIMKNPKEGEIEISFVFKVKSEITLEVVLFEFEYDIEPPRL